MSATRSAEWQDPVNLGQPINSSMDDISIFIAKNRGKGCFTSNRSGGDDDVFLFDILDENHSPAPPVWQPSKEEEPLVELSEEAKVILEEIQQEDSLQLEMQATEISTDSTTIATENASPKDTTQLVIPVSEKIKLQVLNQSPTDTIAAPVPVVIDTTSTTTIDSLSSIELPFLFLFGRTN